MENLATVSDVLYKVDDAIYNATDGQGTSVHAICSKSFESHNLKSMLFIAGLPLFVFFSTVLLLKNVASLSTNVVLFGGSFLAVVISVFSLFVHLGKSEKLRNRLDDTMQNKVDISTEVLDIMYDRLSLLVTIERKYDLTIKELDNIRNRFYKTMILMRNHEDIKFLNPENITK